MITQNELCGIETARSSLCVPVSTHRCGPFLIDLGGLTGLKSMRCANQNREARIAFGVETGNRGGFLTFEHMGLGCEILDGQVMTTANGYTRKWRHTIGVHEFLAEEELAVEADHILRRFEITPAKDIALPLFDAVLRWGFSTDAVRNLRVGNTAVAYERRNLYHQYPVDTVSFDLCGHPVMIQASRTAALPSGFKEVFYARDASEGWIVHHRVIVAEPSEYYLRGCTRLWQGTMTTSKTACHRFSGLRDFLYLVRERRIPRFPVQLMGDVRLAAGESVCLQHKVCFT
jgi:hypothetical protein